jgi:hypothetical protein
VVVDDNQGAGLDACLRLGFKHVKSIIEPGSLLAINKGISATKPGVAPAKLNAFSALCFNQETFSMAIDRQKRRIGDSIDISDQAKWRAGPYGHLMVTENKMNFPMQPTKKALPPKPECELKV